jgi:CheY-like chemotaxis protein
MAAEENRKMHETGGHKPQILIIEDNPGDVELLRLALENAGLDCDITVLDDGGKALAFVQQRTNDANRRTPDLAIVDLNLPKNDGLEILEAMRLNPDFAKVPVAVLSSSSLPRERARMQALHVGHYVMKPSNLEEFMQIGTVLKELLIESRSGH